MSVLPVDATNRGLEWVSSDESVATVQDGTLKILSKGTTLISASAADGSGVASSCEVTILDIPNEVDLGLSVIWGSFNLGANSPEGYGDYYAWGEVETKEDYSFDNYRFARSYTGPYSKYNTVSSYGTVDGKTVLETQDDPVSLTYKGLWRMPTNEEFAELMDENNCTWAWTRQNGVVGYLVTSKKAGHTDQSVFLPAAGIKQGNESLYGGETGFYWSASLGTESPSQAYLCMFSESAHESAQTGRFVGLPIRPVKD